MFINSLRKKYYIYFLFFVYSWEHQSTPKPRTSRGASSIKRINNDFQDAPSRVEVVNDWPTIAILYLGHD